MRILLCRFHCATCILRVVSYGPLSVDFIVQRISLFVSQLYPTIESWSSYCDHCMHHDDRIVATASWPLDCDHGIVTIALWPLYRDYRIVAIASSSSHHDRRIMTLNRIITIASWPSLASWPSYASWPLPALWSLYTLWPSHALWPLHGYYRTHDHLMHPGYCIALWPLYRRDRRDRIETVGWWPSHRNLPLYRSYCISVVNY